MKDTVSVKKGRKQRKDVRGWKRHSLEVIHCPDPEHQHVLPTFLVNGERWKIKLQRLKKTHICRAWSLRNRLSVIKVITSPKQT